MTGTIKNIIPDRLYGFIRGENNIEYFFHKDDMKDKISWDDLTVDIHNMKVKVTFDVAESTKGPRAANVYIADLV